MARRRNFAFVVELFLLFVILLFVIVVIAKTFVMSRNQSLYARHLTEAVYVAEEVAEVTMSADMPLEAEALAARLASLAQTEEANVTADGIELKMEFDTKDDRQDHYRVLLNWQDTPGNAGVYTDSTIQVFFAEETEPIYTLNAGDYSHDS